MSELTKTITIDVWTNQPISEDEVHKAYYLFRRDNKDEPTELVLGIDAQHDFLRNIDVGRLLNLDSYMGMKIKVDTDIDSNKWHVRKSEAKTYDTQDKL